MCACSRPRWMYLCEFFSSSSFTSARCLRLPSINSIISLVLSSINQSTSQRHRSSIDQGNHLLITTEKMKNQSTIIVSNLAVIHPPMFIVLTAADSPLRTPMRVFLAMKESGVRLSQAISTAQHTHPQPSPQRLLRRRTHWRPSLEHPPPMLPPRWHQPRSDQPRSHQRPWRQRQLHQPRYVKSNATLQSFLSQYRFTPGSEILAEFKQLFHVVLQTPHTVTSPQHCFALCHFAITLPT